MLRQCGLFLHDSLERSGTALFDDARLAFLTAAVTLAAITFAAGTLLADAVQEVNHLLQVLLRVHLGTSVTTFCRECGLGLHTSGLQQFEELLTLAVGHDIVLVAVEDDYWRIVGIDIVHGTQAEIFVGLLCEFRGQQHVLRTVVAHLHMFAAVHRREVYRTAPVAGCINGTALVEVVAYGSL